MGQILTAGQGQNPARQAAIAAGIPEESPAWGVNQLCGSGLRAVALGDAGDPHWRRGYRGRGREGMMSRRRTCAKVRYGSRWAAASWSTP